MNKIPDQVHWKLRDISIRKLEGKVYPTTLGYQTCPPGFQDEMLIDDYLICCVKSGYCMFCKSSLENRDNAQAYRVGPGECFLIPPGVMCSYVAGDGEEWVNAWIAFYGTEVKEYVNNTGFRENSVIYTGAELYDDICTMTDQIVSLPNSLVRAMYASSFLWKMIADLTQKASVLPPDHDARYSHYTEQAMSIMQHNYNIQISEVAAALNISREHFYKLFVQDIGKSPSRYFLDLRLEKAYVLLMESDYPINTIANYLGFYDHASFTKRFREKYGMPPKVFREKYK